MLFFVIVLWSLSVLVWKGSPAEEWYLQCVMCSWFSEGGVQKVFLPLRVLSLTKVVLMRKLLFQQIVYVLLGNGGLSWVLALRVGRQVALLQPPSFWRT